VLKRLVITILFKKSELVELRRSLIQMDDLERQIAMNLLNF